MTICLNNERIKLDNGWVVEIGVEERSVTYNINILEAIHKAIEGIEQK